MVQEEANPRSLVTISEATRMLAEAKTLEDVAQIHDLAAAALVYARQHKLGMEAQNHAGTICVEANIKRGEILKRMADAKERSDGGKPYQKSVFTTAESAVVKPTLSALKTTFRESSDAQALAAEAEAVREWMAKAKQVTPSRAARVARDAKARRVRKETPPPVLSPSCDLRLGDFREVLADVPSASVDVILTDPPYPAEFMHLWSDLGEYARRVLKPTGLLVAMSGQTHLPEVMRRLGEHMPYRWTMAYMMPGAANVVHARAVSTMWKPVLVYGPNNRRLHDVIRSDSLGDGKNYHAWGQSESGFAELLKVVAAPGATICDPFVGGGTTAIVALAAGCKFIGAENDADTYRRAADRIAVQ